MIIGDPDSRALLYDRERGNDGDNGTAFGLNQPRLIVMDLQGNVIVADRVSQRVIWQSLTGGVGWGHSSRGRRQRLLWSGVPGVCGGCIRVASLVGLGCDERGACCVGSGQSSRGPLERHDW